MPFLPQVQVAPNMVTFNALISVCTKLGEPNHAELVLREMTSARIEPEPSTVESLLLSCMCSSDPSEVVQLVHRVQQLDGLSRSVRFAYLSMIENVASRGQHVTALQLCDCMHKEPNSAALREGILQLLNKLQSNTATAHSLETSESGQQLLKRLQEQLVHNF